MFGVSLPELILVFVLVLIIFGPDKLPEIARSLGKLTGTLKKSSDAIRRDVYDAMHAPEKLIDNLDKEEISPQSDQTDTCDQTEDASKDE